MLLAAIDERHRGTYDFIYLPIDFKASFLLLLNLFYFCGLMFLDDCNLESSTCLLFLFCCRINAM